MTRDELITRLRSYRILRNKALMLKLKIQDLRRQIDEPKGMTISEVGPIDGGKRSLQFEKIGKLADLENQYIEYLINAEQTCSDIALDIQLLGASKEYQVLFMYYCSTDNMNITRIAQEINYSFDRTRHILYEGIDHLLRLLNNNI